LPQLCQLLSAILCRGPCKREAVLRFKWGQREMFKAGCLEQWHPSPAGRTKNNE